MQVPSARVPKCPVGDVRLESGSARMPECPSARPLFFFLEGMEMVGLRGGVPEGPSAVPFFFQKKNWLSAQIPECQTLSFPGGTI